MSIQRGAPPNLQMQPSTALLKAKQAYNAQAMREGRASIGEHDLEEAVWAVYELLLPARSEVREKKD